MKRAVIVRHAKSSWTHDVNDIDRPLNARGERDAPEMARRFCSRPIRPSLLISSPANRALTTARLFAVALAYPHERIVVCDDVYQTDADGLIQILRAVDDEHETVALFGHNPQSTDLVNRLLGACHVSLPTGAVATLAIDVPRWQDVIADSATLVDFDYPKKSR